MRLRITVDRPRLRDRLQVAVRVVVENCRIAGLTPVLMRIVRVGLIEARMPTIEAAEHRFVRLVRIPVIARESSGLKCGTERTIRVRAPRVEFDGAYNRARGIRDSLALRDRVFKRPKHPATLLHRHLTAAGIHVTALPAIRINLSDDLSTQNT